MNKFGPPKNPISKKDIEIDSKKCKSIINKVQPLINKDNVMENNTIASNNNNNNENILFDGSLDVKVIDKGLYIIIHTKKININSDNNKTNTINQQSVNKNIEIMEIENENNEANNALIFAPNRKKIET